MLVLVSGAQATTNRTFVSNSGDDANAASDCKRPTPCRTFAVAFAHTQSGGQIVALDATGFGPLTINRPVTVIGPADSSYISVAANTVGITLSAGATDRVVIRNMNISGDGLSNTTGILVNSGLLVLQNSIVKELTTGLKVNGTKADVINTDFFGNTLAIQTNGAGAAYNSGVGLWFCPCTTLVRINAGNFISNTTVFTENNPTSTNGQSSATFYVLQNGTQFSANITGYTNLMTVTGTGAVPPGPGVQTYGGSSAPN